MTKRNIMFPFHILNTGGAHVFPRVEELKQVVQLGWNTLPMQSLPREAASPIKYNGVRPHNPAAEVTVRTCCPQS